MVGALLLLAACRGDPANLGPTPDETLEQARLAAYRGQSASAFRLFRELYGNDPRLLDAWEGAADAAEAAGAREEMVRDLDRRLAELGSRASRDLRIPLETLRAGLEPDLVAREALLYELISRARDQAGWPYAALADLVRERGNPRAALELYEKAVDVTPNLPRAMRGLASMLLATKPGLRAAPVYEQYLRARPQDPKALYNLAVILITYRRRPRDARPYLERALNILPDDVDILVNLGAVALLQDEPDVDAAREYFERARRVAPDDPEVYYNLGVLNADHLKDPDSAIGHFRHYLEFGGGGTERIRAWIEELERQRGRR